VKARFVCLVAIAITTVLFAGCFPESETESYPCPSPGATLCATCPVDTGGVTHQYCNSGLTCPSDPCSLDTTCLDANGQEDWGDGVMYNCGVEGGASTPSATSGTGGCYPPTGCGYGWLNDCDNLCYETAEDCATAGPPQGCYSGTCRQCP
jgi:hypothetical protein